jgi:hypothetical protein
MSFLPGNLITMSDDSKKKIEDLNVGDIVKNGYGKNVFVRGIRNLATTDHFFRGHDVPGERPVKINNEIVCMKDQVFIGADDYFYVIDGVNNDIMYNVNTMFFITYDYKLIGFVNFSIKDRTKELKIGSIIMKDTGPVKVETIEYLPPVIVKKHAKDIWEEFYYKNNDNLNARFTDFNPVSEPIIKHKIGWNGTYIVDGYICLSTQNEFWDYDLNQKVPGPTNQARFLNHPDGTVERVINK